MAGSQTSTPTHSGIVSTSSDNIHPTAQSTPLTAIRPYSGLSTAHNSLLTTPTLSSDMSAHSTPKIQKMSPERSNLRNLEVPRTPTPFKRALAEVYSAGEPLSNTPQTPNKRVEDITEIIKKDMLDFTDMSFNNSDIQVILLFFFKS
jgi:hypothetical protein